MWQGLILGRNALSRDEQVSGFLLYEIWPKQGRPSISSHEALTHMRFITTVHLTWRKKGVGL